MRVLYFVERFWPFIGGVEIMSARILPELADRGIEFAIVTSREADELPERDRYRGIDVHRLPFERALRTKDVDTIASCRQRFAAIKEEFAPDLQHMLFTGAGIYFALMAAAVRPCPVLLSFHGSWPLAVFRRQGLVRQVMAASDWFTGCSDSTLAELVSVDGTIVDRATTIYNGLDFAAEPGPLDFEHPLILCSARIEPEKGMDLAVEAVRQLRDEFPALRLRIVGDGSVRRELELSALRAGLDGAVEFMGWRAPDEMPRLVEQATIVLVPSRLEGFGLVALEGMAAGRPVIATRVGGLQEVVGEDGGILVEPSAGAIADAVRELLRDPARAKAVARAGRLRAQAVFPLHRCVDAYESLYRELTTNTHAS
ncbi:MAG TPA: glycosyltransferase family 4 protein [Gaiellaceae bacterium]|jgi:glycogen(starch) synthase|nr:glycosyltransferase family 4 protein [Gaiellaceae bacterium]